MEANLGLRASLLGQSGAAGAAPDHLRPANINHLARGISIEPCAAKIPHWLPKLHDGNSKRESPMRLAVACCSASIALALSGCSSTGTAPAADLPLSVGNGVGSQYGNYAAQMDGEMRGPSGERCVIFNWDRPLTKALAIRVRSASCESKEHPGWMVCTEISRTVIPISESNLKDEQDEARQ